MSTFYFFHEQGHCSTSSLVNSLYQTAIEIQILVILGGTLKGYTKIFDYDPNYHGMNFYWEIFFQSHYELFFFCCGSKLTHDCRATLTVVIPKPITLSV